MKLDNKKVKLADKKRVKTKEEPKKESLVVKFTKPVKPSQNPPVVPDQNPLNIPGPMENSEEMEILRSLHEYNNRKILYLFENLFIFQKIGSKFSGYI